MARKVAGSFLKPAVHTEIQAQAPGATPSGSGGTRTPMKPPAGAGGVAQGHTGYQRLLSAKQGVASLTAQPTHTSVATEGTRAEVRADAIITFATSIAANQPVATLFDRIRAYDGSGQWAEVEGRALPVSAYFYSWLRYLMSRQVTVPGFDKALANTTQAYCGYATMGFTGKRTGISFQDVIKVQPYTGTGAASAYAENDGTGAEYDDTDTALAQYFVARSYGSGISSLNIKKARAFMIAAANDLNSGFTIKAGGNTYVAEEINDAERRINDYLGTATMSLTGTAASAYNGARGQPQDPFTGAAVFLFGDLFTEDTLVNIAISTAQAVQVAVLSDDGIGAIATG